MKVLSLSFLIMTVLLYSCKQSETEPTTHNCIDLSMIDSSMAIYEIYRPVCGCDGKTYTNDQEAIYLGGVTEFRDGPCTEDSSITEKPCVDSSLIDSTVAVNAIYAPVCGCDGKTYSSAAVATSYGGVTSFTDGECEADTVPETTCIDTSLIDSNVVLPAIYEPVCGCDGKTYSSPGNAKYYGGVKSFSQGECK